MRLIILLSFFLFFHYEAQSLNNCWLTFLPKMEKTQVNAKTLNRLELAEYMLNRPLLEQQKQAIMKAHNVGKKEPGIDGEPAGIGNYTKVQLLKKARILKQSGFTQKETRLLVENKVVGSSKRTRRYLTAKMIEETSPEKIKEIPIKLIEEMPSEELQKIPLERMEGIISQMDPEQIVALILRFVNMTSEQKILMDEIFQSNYLFLDKNKTMTIEVLLDLIPYMDELPPEQIRAIPPELITMIPHRIMYTISPDTLYFMNSEHIEAMTDRQKGALNAVQMQHLGIVNIDKSKSPFYTIGLKATFDTPKKSTETKEENSSPDQQLSKTTTNQPRKISIKSLKEMSSEELQKIIPLEHMKDMISQMNHEEIVTMISRLKDMTPDQKKIIDEILQSNYLFLDRGEPVSPETLRRLIPYMDNLPFEQIVAIPSDLIKTIPLRWIKEIPIGALYSMKLEQIDAMTDQQKSALTTHQLQYLGSAHVER